MKKILPYFATLLLLPLIAAAQTAQAFLVNFTSFLSNVIIPFLFGVAFLFFVINVIRFFVIGGSNEDGREKARALISYSVAAFVFLIIFWGIINMLSSSFGYDNVLCTSDKMSDYVTRGWTTCTNGGSNK